MRIESAHIANELLKSIEDKQPPNPQKSALASHLPPNNPQAF
jgi:hypothetical protein